METNAIKAHGSVLNILASKLKDIFKQHLEMGFSYPYIPKHYALSSFSHRTERYWLYHIVLKTGMITGEQCPAADEAVFQWQPLQSPSSPAGWAVQAPCCTHVASAQMFLCPQKGRRTVAKALPWLNISVT